MPVAIIASLTFSICAVHAEDHLEVTVGARGVGEPFIPELGQNAGIFKKHGPALDLFYTQEAAKRSVSSSRIPPMSVLRSDSSAHAGSS
jgi:hypothetical protein